MSPFAWHLAIGSGILISAALFAILPALRIQWLLDRRRKAASRFRLRREWLEVAFTPLLTKRLQARGLTLAHLDFDDAFALVRERSTRRLQALVGVTIAFSDAAETQAANTDLVTTRRATAVFRLEKGRWTTDGRLLLSPGPADALRQFAKDLSPF